MGKREMAELGTAYWTASNVRLLSSRTASGMLHSFRMPLTLNTVSAGYDPRYGCASALTRLDLLHGTAGKVPDRPQFRVLPPRPSP